MSRYKLFSDRLINMITPISQRGRGHILWLQSIIKPLQDVNDTFQKWTKDKIIESNVSSQVIHFTWYLNYKFNEYLIDTNDKIKIIHYVDFGVPTFSDGEIGELPNTTFSTTEDWSLELVDEQPKGLYFEFESLSAIGASFKISVPEISIDQTKFDIMLKAEVERYRICGKTYTIEHT